MSDRYTAVMTALTQDPELQARVLAAATPEERAALLSAAGLELPTTEEIEAAKLADVAGGAQGSTAVDCAYAACSMAAAST
jgi:Nif11 domain